MHPINLGEVIYNYTQEWVLLKNGHQVKGRIQMRGDEFDSRYYLLHNQVWGGEKTLFQMEQMTQPRIADYQHKFIQLPPHCPTSMLE